MSEDLLKIAPAKLAGPNLNREGNFCIIAHNNLDGTMFSKLNNLNIGDKVILITNAGYEVEYKVYKKYNVFPENLSPLDQNLTNKKEVTLITCTNDLKKRLIVKCE
jgi:sortase A